MFLRDRQLFTEDGNRVPRTCVRPYAVVKKIEIAGCLLQSEAGNSSAGVHVNRLQNIDNLVSESDKPKNGVFSDRNRLLQKIKLSVRRGEIKCSERMKGVLRNIKCLHVILRRI